MTCSAFLTSIGFNGVLCTSDIACYNGPQFSCVTIPTNATLNQVLAAIADKICEVEASIVTPVNAANVVYSGDLVFGCFTLVGANVEAVIESLATEVCTLAGTIPADASDIPRGSNIVYNGGVTPGIAADPIDTLFNDIMSALGTTNTTVTGKAALSDVATYVGTYFRMADFVYVGGTGTPSGLDVTIDDGLGGDSIYGINGYVITVAPDTVTLTATADNYIDVDESGVYTVTPVAIAAPAPPIPTDSMRLYKYTTNALNVTATTDLKNPYPIVSPDMFADDVVLTRNIADLNVTGAKLETLGAGATVGSADFYYITYDTKGRVTAGGANFSFAGLSAGDLMQYDGAGWVNWTPNYIDGSGTASYVPRFTDADTIGNSTIQDDGTTTGVNVGPAANTQFYTRANAVGISTAGRFDVAGANASNVGITGQATNGTSVNAGIMGVGGATIAFPKATGIVGVVGTGYVDAAVAIHSYGGFFAVDTHATATGDTFGVYIDAINSGAGRAYGFVVENGKCLIGAASSTDDSALLEIVSTTQGVRFPNMTTAQKNAIGTPTAGLVVYDTTLGKLCVYTSAWETITSA